MTFLSQLELFSYFQYLTADLLLNLQSKNQVSSCLKGSRETVQYETMYAMKNIKRNGDIISSTSGRARCNVPITATILIFFPFS